jgi:hypothetical protein
MAIYKRKLIYYLTVTEEVREYFVYLLILSTEMALLNILCKNLTICV